MDLSALVSEGVEWDAALYSKSLKITARLYSLDTILKTAYLFLDKCFIFVEPLEAREESIRYTSDQLMIRPT